MLMEVSSKVMPPYCSQVGIGRRKPIAPADGRYQLSIVVNA